MRRCRTAAAAFALPAVLCGVALVTHAESLAAAQDDRDVLQKYVAVSRYREEHLPSYTVVENYKLYSPREQQPTAEVTFRMDYVRGKGKSYQLTGTPQYRKPFVETAIHRMVEGQQHASLPQNRPRVLINPENYEMKLLPGDVAPHFICQLPRRSFADTYAISLKPRERRSDLIEGTMWIDRNSLRVVRIEGQFSAAPSFFIGRPLIERDYRDMDGLAFAYSSCQVTGGLVAHQRSQITYEKYVLYLPPSVSTASK